MKSCNKLLCLPSRRAIAVHLSCLLFAVALLLPALPVSAASYANGFGEEVAASGFGFDVTNVDWLPDGSMLISQKGGKVTLIKNGVKSTFADIGPFINNDLPGTDHVQGDR